MILDVVCPPGVSEGDFITVHGYEVPLPPGIVEGDTFQVDIPDAGCEQVTLPVLGSIQAALDSRGEPYGGADVLEAALNTLIDAIEDHENPALDELVDGNCAEFAEWEEGGGNSAGTQTLISLPASPIDDVRVFAATEAQLHWTALQQDYTGLVESHISGVLGSLDCTPESVFLYAAQYSGDDERVQKLIKKLLALADFNLFCGMMRERYEILEMFNS